MTVRVVVPAWARTAEPESRAGVQAANSIRVQREPRPHLGPGTTNTTKPISMIDSRRARMHAPLGPWSLATLMGPAVFHHLYGLEVKGKHDAVIACVHAGHTPL